MVTTSGFALSMKAPMGDNPSTMPTANENGGNGSGLRPTEGRLHLICGCMFAGKTEELLDRVAALPAGQVRVFKHEIDTRYHPTRVVSHRGRSCPAFPVGRATQVLERVNRGIELVAIDEGHFFDDQLPQVCSTLVDRGMLVLVTALDKGSWGQPFRVVDALRAIAGVVTIKSSRCARCGRRATCTQRLTPIIDGQMVSGPESFEPRCDQCWTPPPASCDQMIRRASNTGPCVQQSS